MSDEFDRIKRLPPYVFAEVNRLKAELRAKGKDIIDFGMGNPDMPTPKHIREKLKETVEKPGTGRYSSSKGIAGLRKAQAAYYKRRFDVDLDPDNEILCTIFFFEIHNCSTWLHSGVLSKPSASVGSKQRGASLFN